MHTEWECILCPETEAPRTAETEVPEDGGAMQKSQKMRVATKVYGLAEKEVLGIGRGAIEVCATQRMTAALSLGQQL